MMLPVLYKHLWLCRLIDLFSESCHLQIVYMAHPCQMEMSTWMMVRLRKESLRRARHIRRMETLQCQLRVLKVCMLGQC